MLLVEWGVGVLDITSPLHGPLDDPGEPKVFRRRSDLPSAMSEPTGFRSYPFDGLVIDRVGWKRLDATSFVGK